MTLFLQLIKDRRLGSVEGIFSMAIERGAHVRIRSQPDKGEPEQNALQIAIKVRSSEMVKLIIVFATRGACDPCEVSEMFSKSLCRLLEKQETRSALRWGVPQCTACANFLPALLYSPNNRMS